MDGFKIPSLKGMCSWNIVYKHVVVWPCKQSKKDDRAKMMDGDNSAFIVHSGRANFCEHKNK